MATAGDVVEEVQRLLNSGQPEEMNRLNTSAGANTPQLAFEFPLGGIRPGSYIDVDLETYRVWSVDDTTLYLATVQAGMLGTTSAAHEGGSLVYVNPRLSRAAVFKSLNDELLGLSSPTNGLFQVKKLEFNYAGVVTDYDLAADVQEVFEARISMPGPEADWTRMTNWSWKPQADTTAFPSGNALHLPGGLPGRAIEILYKAPFTKVATLADDIATVAGMPEEMQDILALGVLLRLGPVREIKRSFTEAQGGTRRAEEVAPGAVNQSFNSLRMLYQQRIQAEAARLAAKYEQHHR